MLFSIFVRVTSLNEKKRKNWIFIFLNNRRIEWKNKDIVLVKICLFNMVRML